MIAKFSVLMLSYIALEISSSSLSYALDLRNNDYIRCHDAEKCQVMKQTVACSMSKSIDILNTPQNKRDTFIKQLIVESACEVLPINKNIEVEKTNNPSVLYATGMGKHVGYIPVGVVYIGDNMPPFELLAELYKIHLILKACHEQDVGNISDEEYVQISNGNRKLEENSDKLYPDFKQIEKDRAWQSNASGYQEITTILKTVKKLNGLTAGATNSAPEMEKLCEQLAIQSLATQGITKNSTGGNGMPKKDF